MVRQRFEEAQRDQKVAALTLAVGMEAHRDQKVAALTLPVGMEAQRDPEGGSTDTSRGDRGTEGQH